MDINFSDWGGESVVLNKECPSKTFHLSLPDFGFYIKHIHFVFGSENEHWHQTILKTAIRVHVFYSHIEQGFSEPFDEMSFPIHLFVDPNTMLPSFPVNKLIDKQIFGKNFELDQVDRIQVKVELIENQVIHEPYHAECMIHYK